MTDTSSAFNRVWAKFRHFMVSREYAEGLFNAGIDAAAAECERQEKCPGLAKTEKYRAGYLKERILNLKAADTPMVGDK